MRTDRDDVETLPRGEPDRDGPVRWQRYEVLRRLGRGSGGDVYEAYDPRIDRRVAIKRLSRPQYSAAGFLREALALSRITHPNVVAVFDADVVGHEAHLVLELVEGTTLDAWVGQDRPWREVLGAFIEAARGLEAIHEAGLLHRDFKPSNVAISADGRVKILDFGLARASDDEAGPTEPELRLGDVEVSSETRPTRVTVEGTPVYMSPEQRHGDPLDPRSDLYAWGASVVHVLTGRPPARGDGPPAWPRGIPRAVRELVQSTLHDDSERRPGSARHLGDRLEHLLARRRRGYTAVVGGTLVAGVAAAGWMLGVDDRHVHCAALRDAAPAGWDHDAQDRLAERFEATGLSYAGVSAALLIAQINDYAGAWAEGRERACLDQEATAEQSRRVRQLRDACLERAQSALVARLSVAQEGGAMAVEHAWRIADGLPPLGRCDDVSWLLARGAVPDEPKLALAQAWGDAGDVRRQTELAEAVRHQARTEGKREIELAASLLRGRGLVMVDRVAAIDALRPVLTESMRAGRPELALPAALGLARVAVAGHRGDEAMGYLLVATGLAERLGDPGAELEVLRGRVDALLLQGKREQARAAAERIRERAAAVHGEASASMADALTLLARVRAEDGSLAKAIETSRRSLALREQIAGARHPLVGAEYRELGARLVADGRAEQARAALEHAHAIHAEALGTEDPRTIRTRLELLELSTADQAPHDAVAQWTRALEEAIDALGAEHEVLIPALRARARALSRAGVDELGDLQAIVELLEARDGASHPSVLVARRDVGVALLEHGRFEAAVDELAAAVEGLLAELGPADPLVLDARLRLGEAHEGLGAHDRALAAWRSVASTETSEAQARAVVERARARVPAEDVQR